MSIMLPLDFRIFEILIVSYEGEKIIIPGECDNRPVCHGQGMAIFKSGMTYNGEFYQGRMHGKGKITWLNGIVYEGEVQQNDISGQGIYKWPNGTIYSGDVVCGKRHGKGALSFPISSTLENLSDYESAMMEEKKSELPNDTAEYDGDWKNGLPCGKGKLIYSKNGNMYYYGDFEQGKRHGKGTITYKEGHTYSGSWVENMKSGFGTMIWMNTDSGYPNEKYQGQWEADIQHGMGRHVWLHGTLREKNWYQGMFQQGKRHGLGTFYYANGARYEGMWENNEKHGKGTFFYEDGRVYMGMFAHDRQVGSEGFSYPPPESQSMNFILFLYDILGTDYSNKIAKELDNAILRLNTELRELYRQYLKPKTKTERIQSNESMESVLLSVDQCRRMLLDGGCNIRPGQLEDLLSHIRKIQRHTVSASATKWYSKNLSHKNPHSWLKDSQEGHQLQTFDNYDDTDVIPAENVILFREFVEIIIRLSMVFRLSEGESTNNVAQTMTEFYDHISATSKSDIRPTIPRSVTSSEMMHLFKRNNGVLQALFKHCLDNSKSKFMGCDISLGALIKSLRKLEKKFPKESRALTKKSFCLQNLLGALCHAIQMNPPDIFDKGEDQEVNDNQSSVLDVHILTTRLNAINFQETLVMIIVLTANVPDGVVVERVEKYLDACKHAL